MSFFDIKSIEYEPELSGKNFHTYHIGKTQFVVIRILMPWQAKIVTQCATSRDMSNYVNTLGRGGKVTSRCSASLVALPSIPFQAVFEQLPTKIQEEFIYELDIFLEK